jgi:SnoaL-like domain
MSESELAPLKRLVIERACEQLCIEYARLVDFRDYDNFAELFAADAVLQVGRRLEGKPAIRASMLQRSEDVRSRHVITNIFIEVLDAQSARGIAYLTLYRHVGPSSARYDPIASTQPTAVGHYEDRYIRTDAGWRFKSRILHVAFRDPATLRSGT